MCRSFPPLQKVEASTRERHLTAPLWPVKVCRHLFTMNASSICNNALRTNAHSWTPIHQLRKSYIETYKRHIYLPSCADIPHANGFVRRSGHNYERRQLQSACNRSRMSCCISAFCLDNRLRIDSNMKMEKTDRRNKTQKKREEKLERNIQRQCPHRHR